ncbi:11513_t:CDS:2 [Dentiscutata erythropus]|uniref:11513_t:CDS:1 n=1 Tax=Dentiscutata erythropus TaxID=1348616 RepID=A0A9N8WJL4_9GLOM|nr:11513_t:CDS:2 [Dentiscutata erythropus]
MVAALPPVPKPEDPLVKFTEALTTMMTRLQKNPTIGTMPTDSTPPQNGGNEAQTFLNMHEEVIDPLFFLAKEIDKPAQHTHSKKRRVEEEASEPLEIYQETQGPTEKESSGEKEKG